MTTVTYSLGLTALPTGFYDGQHLSLSVFLSPSISTDDNTPIPLSASPFDGWTDRVKKHPPTWTVTFVPVQPGNALSTGPSAPQDVSTLYPKLWDNLFGSNRQALNRRGNAVLTNSWRLSHKITQLHNRHGQLRYAHAQRALNATMASNGTDAQSLAELRGLHADYNADVDASAPPALYLYPSLQGDTVDASKRVDDRQRAVADRSNIDNAAGVPATLKTQIQDRVTYSLNLLETKEGERLQAPALYCVYRHCIVSVLPPGTSIQQAAASSDPNHPLFLLYDSFTIRALPLVPPDPAAATAVAAVDAYQNYVEMLLFHRREPDKAVCPIATPDFHQLLGMVNHYPALLRPLGLTFDIVVPIPVGMNDGAYTVAVTAPFSDPTFGNLKNQIASNATACRFGRNARVFYTASRDTYVLDAGYLTLDQRASSTAGSAYSIVQEDADGSSLKLTDQANSAARASEYSSFAPTAMTALRASQRFFPGPRPIVPTPASTANPTDAPAAPRTVGIAIYHEDRLSTLDAIINNAAPVAPVAGKAAVPNVPDILFAEDLMLGIRPDIKRGNRPWRSLCSRQSTYIIYPSGVEDGEGLQWPPTDQPQPLPDEGFVTFAATQTSVDANTTQTQAHQSIVTWTGWSLALPKPEPFQPIPRPAPDPNCASPKPLGIRATSVLPPGALLPALRFNDTYRVRCRVVDLAGNSLPCIDADTPHSIDLDPLFSRHEPIRAPQILLTKPIDRRRSPGESIDHLVARDGKPPTSRMLVPPRESLRLAELHGVITLKNPLPGSAFAQQNLMSNGAFPSVQEAHDQGWITDPIDQDSTHNQDGIYVERTGMLEVVNPFYPDPLAHYIRVKPYLVSDDPTLSRLLGDAFYIEIDPDDDWPNFLATIVNLNSASWVHAPKVEFSNRDRPPSITVNLPRGFTVVLEFSSAGDSGENKPRRTDKSKNVALYQVHRTRVSLLRNTNASQRLLSDLVGSRDRIAEMQRRRTKMEQMRVDLINPSKTAASIVDDPNSYINGDLPQMTPPRTMTFVHAVRKPISKPDFAPKGTAGDLTVVRQRGSSAAALTAGITAHWLSTGKVTCSAIWQDTVDDLTLDGPAQARPLRDVAFAITAANTVRPSVPDFDGATYLRMLKSGLSHGFTDTRAHTVTYSLSAATSFRGYYAQPAKVDATNPPAPPPDGSDYSVAGLTTRKITVRSSARPRAPSLAYIVPAFLWRDTYERENRTWYSGRDLVLRVYIQRPFLVSGDLESLGVVLATGALPSDELTQPHVSRWGADPTRSITSPVLSSALGPKNLCEPDNPVQTCLLAEGGAADIKPCRVHYAKDRKLWFADIPINTQGALAPFIRLALVRWQPHGLYYDVDPTHLPVAPVDPNYDCRISPVVVADFIQLGPTRWVSVQRVTNSTFALTVSGVFSPPESPVGGRVPPPTITLCLYARWYATGKDTGWRQIDCSAQFIYAASSSNASGSGGSESGISTWSTTLRLPHSALTRKYRILLRENEWFMNSGEPRVTYAQFIDLP